MADQQLFPGGPAVVIQFTGEQPPSGTSTPASFNSFNAWANGVKVIPDTSLNALPVTINGLTVTASQIGAANNSSALGSITAQLSSSTSLGNGAYTFNGYNNASNSTALVQIGNVQIPQGTSANVPFTGNPQQGETAQWGIVKPDGSGYLVTGPFNQFVNGYCVQAGQDGGADFLVTIPVGAPLGAGYVATYPGTSSAGEFDITPGTSPQPQNFALAFFSPSAGGSPSLSASWQQPAHGQPDGGYNIYLGSQAGEETWALNVPGASLGHTFAAYGYGTVYGFAEAVYGGVEGSASAEASTSTPAPVIPIPTLTATPQIVNGIPAIILTGF